MFVKTTVRSLLLIPNISSLAKLVFQEAFRWSLIDRLCGGLAFCLIELYCIEFLLRNMQLYAASPGSPHSSLSVRSIGGTASQYQMSVSKQADYPTYQYMCHCVSLSDALLSHCNNVKLATGTTTASVSQNIKLNPWCQSRENLLRSIMFVVWLQFENQWSTLDEEKWQDKCGKGRLLHIVKEQKPSLLLQFISISFVCSSGFRS